ncbi:MAG: class F sortase [Actinomycetota bacterium]|nr:class F sortase [Actinomycetota bacterium]
MTSAPSPKDRAWWVVALVLLTIATGCLTVSLRDSQGSVADAGIHLDPAPLRVLDTTPSRTGDGDTTPPGAGDTTPPTAASTTAPPTAAGSTAPSGNGGTASTPSPAVVAAAARSAPVELRIPAIGLAVSVGSLGLNPDRTVEVPTDFQEPGWFRLGPTPGQVGSAVILGHVDSYQGPAVFFRLRSVQEGDRIEVSLADGSVVQFVVDTVEMYPKEQFPASQVYASHGYSALQLVTCGGAFDSNTRSYLSNVVVYTSLVSVTPPA